MFKRIAISALLGITLATGAHLSFAPRSEALLLFTIAIGGRYDLGPGATVACIALIPFCLLDEKGSSDQSATSDMLRENGYSEQDIAEILDNQARVMAALENSMQKMQIEASETAESLKSGLEALVPNVSDAYVNFMLEFAGQK